MTSHQVTQYDLIAICAQCQQQVKILDGGNVVVHMPIEERTLVIAPCGCPPPGADEPSYWYCSVHRLGSTAKGPALTGETAQFMIGRPGHGKTGQR